MWIFGIRVNGFAGFCDWVVEETCLYLRRGEILFCFGFWVLVLYIRFWILRDKVIYRVFFFRSVFGFRFSIFFLDDGR